MSLAPSPFSDFPLSQSLTENTNFACQKLGSGNAEILNQVSPITAELLEWWFRDDNMEYRDYNFHNGQRQAILNTIYAHEVLQCDNLHALYKQLNASLLMHDFFADEELKKPNNQIRKYCMKMATGSGKTWVLEALLIWQILNAKEYPDNPLFTRNFLIIVPSLIVYDRLLGAFLGKEKDGNRDFDTSDFIQFKRLLIPDNYRDTFFSFIQNATCRKEEIANKTTGGGFIGIANWQAIKKIENNDEEEEVDEIILPSLEEDSKKIVNKIFPILPGKTKGNDLEQLNRKFERGKTMDFLKTLPSLMVFNDEAHHIHSEELQWQQTLTAIAVNKGVRFHQIDFTATPYHQKGKQKLYFPHIITNYDLKTATEEGIVKSLVIDRKIGDTFDIKSNKPPRVKAEKDTDSNIILALDQCAMLRAGLTKLDTLQKSFAEFKRHPKMMVVCEDTNAASEVVKFLQDKALNPKLALEADEILHIDSKNKNEISEEKWSEIREQLFDIDTRKKPSVIVSVLMLREGFDVNNVCVIVPLRTANSKILVEQIIGRGLRIMWREKIFKNEKKENRQLLNDGHKPKSMFDILSIIEHPSFISFYDDLVKDGILNADPIDDPKSPTGEIVSVGLREGYKKYDFAIPKIIREEQEELEQKPIDIYGVPAFEEFTLEQLKNTEGAKETYRSTEVMTDTTFGDYTVKLGGATLGTYNSYLVGLTRRISEAPTQHASKNKKSKFPYLQIAQPKLLELLDEYIKTQLFGKPFDPLHANDWEVLVKPIVVRHIVEKWQRKLLESEDSKITQEREVEIFWLSDQVEEFKSQKSRLVDVKKCIYQHLDEAAQGGGLERRFMEACSNDASVDAFCKIKERGHLAARIQYQRIDGIFAHYYPDFLVSTKDYIYLVETKAENQTSHPDVQAKAKAAIEWCENINKLNAEHRSASQWAYVLLSEDTFYFRNDKGQSIADMLYETKAHKAKPNLLDED